jgi:hypothetical protein
VSQTLSNWIDIGPNVLHVSLATPSWALRRKYPGDTQTFDCLEVGQDGKALLACRADVKERGDVHPSGPDSPIASRAWELLVSDECSEIEKPPRSSGDSKKKEVLRLGDGIGRWRNHG